jgi:hypothetical protein
VREVQQGSNNQADWDRYVDSRIALYNSRHADESTMPDALREALGRVLAEERQQWRRERALIELEAKAVISDLSAVIAELQNEIRQKELEAKPGAPGVAGPRGPSGSPKLGTQADSCTAASAALSERNYPAPCVRLNTFFW